MVSVRELLIFVRLFFSVPYMVY